MYRSPKRLRSLSKAKPLDTRKPEQCLQAVRDVRVLVLVLDRLAQSPCSMLDLRRLLPDPIAAALVPAMLALVRSGAVTAIGPGLYDIVAAPNGRPVRASPARDLTMDCLAVASRQGEIAYYTGMSSADIRAALSTAVRNGHAYSPERGVYHSTKTSTG